MKFMKLGSKPDSFKSDGDNIRHMETEQPADIVVNVSNVKFYLHKFPLLSKSARLHKLITIASQENKDEINIQDTPGGPAAFEICVKYCYGMTVTLNAYNVVAARCAAEYLEMSDTVEKGNLIYKIDVFLNSSIFRGWKDSIIVLQTTKSLLPWSEELKVVNRCVDSLASKASVDTSKVEWSYTYNRKKVPWENEMKRQPTIPNDWWVEDLSDLDIDLYKRVITTIKSKGKASSIVIGEALKTYALRRLPGFNKGTIQGGDTKKNQSLVETIARLLPKEKGSISCSFLLGLLRASISLECGGTVRTELLRRIGLQLDEATVTDLLIRAPPGETTVYDVDMVRTLVKEFVVQEQDLSGEHDLKSEIDLPVIQKPQIVSNTSKGLVAKLVDRYLAEISKDPNLPLSKFVGIAELVSGYPRPSHDGIYRAIDMYLKEHPGINKSDKKRICKFMDCRKLSVEACAHAVQNERLPLRVVVQVIFFEQAQAQAQTRTQTQTPDLTGPVKSMIPGGSNGSSRSTTTNTEEDWEGDELKGIKGELSSLRLGDAQATCDNDRNNMKRSQISKRMIPKLWSTKDREDENSSSDTSESPASTNAEEMRSYPIKK